MDVTPACDSSGLPQDPQGLQFGCWKLVNSRVNEKGGDNVGSQGGGGTAMAQALEACGHHLGPPPAPASHSWGIWALG